MVATDLCHDSKLHFFSSSILMTLSSCTSSGQKSLAVAGFATYVFSYCFCDQLKFHPELYAAYVPMPYDEYLKNNSKYITFSLSFTVYHFSLLTSTKIVTGMANGVIMSHCRLLLTRY